jgi:hypothetical protein
MVDLFLRVLPPYPVGTQVVVAEGRWKGFHGVVATAPREALDRPRVRLLADDRDQRIDPVTLDLAREDAAIRGTLRWTAAEAPVAAG